MLYYTYKNTYLNTHYNKERGYIVPRPKTGLPTKEKINLSVTAEVKGYLNQLSQVRQQSISEIVSQYAEQEIKKLNRKQSREQTKGEKA